MPKKNKNKKGDNKERGGGQKSKKSGRRGGGATSSGAAPRNEIAAGTVASLLASKLSPSSPTAGDATTRRRIEMALHSASYIQDVQQLPSFAANKKRTDKPVIVLFRGGSFEAAEWAQHELMRLATSDADPRWYKPAVLDFASDSNPGGGWRGQQQGTQEEELCRISSLGLALEGLASNAGGRYSIPHHGCVYVEDVAVVRQKNGTWLENPYWCSVVAAALRNADGHTDHIQRKVRGVVSAAAGHGAFVGGAWGCGAFGNDTGEVAEAWRIAANRSPESLAMLVLALPAKQNFAVFQSVFPDALVVQ